MHTATHIFSLYNHGAYFQRRLVIFKVSGTNQEWWAYVGPNLWGPVQTFLLGASSLPNSQCDSQVPPDPAILVNGDITSQQRGSVGQLSMDPIYANDRSNCM